MSSEASLEAISMSQKGHLQTFPRPRCLSLSCPPSSVVEAKSEQDGLLLRLRALIYHFDPDHALPGRLRARLAIEHRHRCIGQSVRVELAVAGKLQNPERDKFHQRRRTSQS
jgi:hypothetical protein